MVWLYGNHLAAIGHRNCVRIAPSPLLRATCRIDMLPFLGMRCFVTALALRRLPSHHQTNRERGRRAPCSPHRRPLAPPRLVAVTLLPMRHACRMASLAVWLRAAKLRRFRKSSAIEGGYGSGVTRRGYDPLMSARGVADFRVPANHAPSPAQSQLHARYGHRTEGTKVNEGGNSLCFLRCLMSKNGRLGPVVQSLSFSVHGQKRRIFTKTRNSTPSSAGLARRGLGEGGGNGYRFSTYWSEGAQLVVATRSRS